MEETFFDGISLDDLTSNSTEGTPEYMPGSRVLLTYLQDSGQYCLG